MNNVLTLRNGYNINDIPITIIKYYKSTESVYKTQKLNNDMTKYIIPAEITLNKTYNKNYSLKTPIKLSVYISSDKMITCLDEKTNMYGIGATLEESEKDFADSFFYHYEFLKNNTNYLSKIDIENLKYINNTIQEYSSEK